MSCRYTRFLKDFLESAEENFMLGYRVHYFLFTDHPEWVPNLILGAGRQLTKIKCPSSARWQEITSRRMEMIEKLIEERLLNEADFIFSLDVDTKFYGHWGAETLGNLIAVLHPGYFGSPRTAFPYERRSKSVAFIPPEEGDYYYGGAVIGGRVSSVHKLVKTCRQQLDADRANQIEAAWQEESHLNKYFLYNKPSKVLSPEYLWQDFKKKTSNMKVIRFSQVIKNYNEVRPNK
ncbi:Globoside alpha-1,3-N-acetylgalactosaminyltransferase 1 [Bagarius yarrelli]|uniref:Globoside alpha-1,3-N-acetylgalactosaminyltransferase 1 n=1 Tax=Bagarius yarrelli TaxID=175774 RepID=A0A556VX81_BAGYA|nr:Globoside alpha-1,3-N-acetylgalactosaminyltransferase 1 [Bagarius yarrelli]